MSSPVPWRDVYVAVEFTPAWTPPVHRPLMTVPLVSRLKGMLGSLHEYSAQLPVFNASGVDLQRDARWLMARDGIGSIAA